MDCAKTGIMIRRYRKEKGYTQEKLAQLLNISHKTVSKWECGLGFPDASLLADLTKILGADADKILKGEETSNRLDVGNLQKIKFYLCNDCKNIITSTSKANVCCCGKKLGPVQAQEKEEKIPYKIEEIDREYVITFEHEMTKKHFISFVAVVDKGMVVLKKLYPESEAQVRIPYMRHADLYFYCIQDGMHQFKIK